MYSTVPCIKSDNGSMVPSSHDVVMEVPLSVFVNGRHALTAMISPTMLEEFVTGFLYTERIIRKLEDIDSLRIEEKKKKCQYPECQCSYKKSFFDHAFK